MCRYTLQYSRAQMHQMQPHQHAIRPSPPRTAEPFFPEQSRVRNRQQLLLEFRNLMLLRATVPLPEMWFGHCHQALSDEAPVSSLYQFLLRWKPIALFKAMVSMEGL